jgi:hypothetical protein
MCGPIICLNSLSGYFLASNCPFKHEYLRLGSAMPLVGETGTVHACPWQCMWLNLGAMKCIDRCTIKFTYWSVFFLASAYAYTFFSSVMERNDLGVHVFSYPIFSTTS